MSEQDDPDVIEQAPRHASFRWRPGSLTVALVGCLLVAAAGTFAGLRLTASGPANPDLSRLITEVTTVPVDTGAPVGFIARSGALPGTPPPSVKKTKPLSLEVNRTRFACLSFP